MVEGEDEEQKGSSREIFLKNNTELPEETEAGGAGRLFAEQ